MIFNSIEFGIFFTIVFVFYWMFFYENNTVRNIYLIIVSYIFYGWWDWRFLSLIVISSLADYIIGGKIFEEEKQNKRKLLLIISLCINLGFLCFFKYYNFFIDSLIKSFSIFGQKPQISTLNIILPVGISFYTFQTLSYTLDIYKKNLKPTKNIFAFFAFVSFFPQLVAGPIERAKHLLPQFNEGKKLNYENIRSGLLLMAWGFFKKIVIADRLARFIDAAYLDLNNATGLIAVYAVIFFAFQLYIDFSAYSDIAIGGARMLGFNLTKNFNHPYLSSSFSDFWKRWHISLSSWFQDYFYIPLGGNRKGKWKTKINIMIVFLFSGLWHGASWNFVVWGAINGGFLIFLEGVIVKINKYDKRHLISSILVTSLWALSLVFFRSETLGDSLSMFSKLGFSNIESIYNFGLCEAEFKFTLFLLAFLMAIEILQERKENLYNWFISKPVIIRWSLYMIIVLAIIMLGSYGVGLNDSQFIYFQF